VDNTMTAGETDVTQPTADLGGNVRAVMEDNAISIMLVDDHDVVRRGLRSIVEAHAGWRVKCEATTGREAIELVRTCLPDVVVADLGLPELNGLAAIRRIRQEAPASEVIVFSMYETEFLVRESIAAGARGYVLKSDGARQLTAAIESVLMHKPYFSSSIAATIRDILTRDDDDQVDLAPPAPLLTFREREIVQLLAEGKTNKEIAAALSISAKTVETHRSAIMRKLGLRSLADLVRYALRNGISFG
jgi:DNA-binding NarL/FixJ family response regulator